MATAFFWPTSTTSRFQHGVVLGQHRDHHGRIFRALALVDRRGIGRHQRVQLAEAVDQIASLESRWTLLTKVETSCDRILIAGGANVEAEWEQGPAV